MERVFANAGNLSEFVSGRHGTCGELATLAALHVVRPHDWPLSAASLERIAQWEIGKGLASNPSGAEAPHAIEAFLDSINVAYSVADSSQLVAILDELAGIHPVIVEYANAQALPGDEAGVHFHYNCCLGRDMSAPAYIFADGDNYSVRRTNGLGPLDKYTPANLAAAQPVSVIVIEEFAMITLELPEVAKYFEASADGASWTCVKTGQVIRGGMLPHYQSIPSASGYAGLYELGLPITNEIVIDRKFLSRDLGSGEPIPTIQRFERGERIYDPQHIVDTPVNAFDDHGIYPAHIDTDPGRW